MTEPLVVAATAAASIVSTVGTELVKHASYWRKSSAEHALRSAESQVQQKIAEITATGLHINNLLTEMEKLSELNAQIDKVGELLTKAVSADGSGGAPDAELDAAVAALRTHSSLFGKLTIRNESLALQTMDIEGSVSRDISGLIDDAERGVDEFKNRCLSDRSLPGLRNRTLRIGQIDNITRPIGKKLRDAQRTMHSLAIEKIGVPT